MTGDLQLIDTNVLVHAYTVSNDKKHRLALPLVERIWEGEEAATTLQNLCEFFSVVTRKVTKPLSGAAAETTVEAILGSSRWRVIDRTSATVLKAIELVKVTRLPFWDALIGACMLEHGINTIVSENELKGRATAASRDIDDGFKHFPDEEGTERSKKPGR